MPYFDPDRVPAFDHLDVEGNNQSYHLHPDHVKYEDDTSRAPACTPSIGRPLYFKTVLDPIEEHLKVHPNLDTFNLDLLIETFDEEYNTECFLNPWRWHDKDDEDKWNLCVACIKIEYERVDQLLKYFDPTCINEYRRLRLLGGEKNFKRAYKWGDLYHRLKALRQHPEKWTRDLREMMKELQEEREEEERKKREEEGKEI